MRDLGDDHALKRRQRAGCRRLGERGSFPVHDGSHQVKGFDDRELPGVVPTHDDDAVVKRDRVFVEATVFSGRPNGQRE